MMENLDFKFLKFIVSSNIRSSVLFSLMDGSKSSAELKNDVDANGRNLLKALRQLADLDLVCKTGKEYSLTNSGKLIVLNIRGFMDESSEPS